MDETMKIYTPRKAAKTGAALRKQVVRQAKDTNKVVRYFKNQSRLQTLEEVFSDRQKNEEKLNKKYPAFNVFYNWLIAGVVLALFVSFGIWCLSISTSRKAAALTATAMAEYQAEQDAIERQKQDELDAIAASEETVMKQEAQWCAKLLYGIKNFVDKYHYSEVDMMTYLRCVFNRVENETNGFKTLDTIEAVVNQDDQWTGYFSNNPALTEYYEIAYDAVEQWHHEETKPVSSDYLWAELTPNGIFLKNDYKADGYARRWRYSG